MSLRRIQSELLDFGRDPPDCASAGPINKDDLLSWGGFIKDLVLGYFASEINIFF